MTEVLKKIHEAKKLIRKTPLKKAGRNSYSGYDYFTPEQVDQLVFDACDKLGLVTVFRMERDEHGITGVLTIASPEEGQIYEVPMATDIPSIKATNVAQQLGGAMTYTERYLKMTVFGITDNNLDHDTSENTEKREKPVKLEITEEVSEKLLKNAETALAKGKFDMKKFKTYLSKYEDGKTKDALINLVEAAQKL